MEIRKAEPCPFCGSKDLRLDRIHPQEIEYQIVCNRCGANGPPCDSKSFDTAAAIRGALAKWDTRK